MDCPHVFVKYAQGMFSYGVVGSMPIGQLVGFIIRVQAELAFREPDPCDDGMCRITFNLETSMFSWCVDKDIPVDALVGTLELIKCQLVDSQMASMALAAQQRASTGLISPNGQPITRN